MSARIRWEPTKHGGWTGHVGTIKGFVFQVWKPTHPEAEPYRLQSGLPGYFGRFKDSASPDELKAEAERWLSEFVSSLGAVFPVHIRNKELFVPFADEDDASTPVLPAPTEG